MEGYSSNQLRWKTIVVQSLSCVQPFVTPWTAACQASLSFTIFQSLLKLMSIKSVMPSNHLILCCSFSSCVQSFTASGSFLMSWLFASGGQRTGASVSALVLLLMEGNGNPLSYSYLGNPMERKVWWAIVHVVAKSQTRLKRSKSSSRKGQ